MQESKHQDLRGTELEQAHLYSQERSEAKQTVRPSELRRELSPMYQHHAELLQLRSFYKVPAATGDCFLIALLTSNVTDKRMQSMSGLRHAHR